MSKKYDVVIIGGGVSGLHAAALLSKNNFKVCVLEKHSKIGGGLHNFSRKGKIFDTGIHYVSSLGPDKPLGKFYKYLGIADKFSVLEMDKNGYDVVIRSDDDNQYPIAADKELFINNLLKYFPNDKEDLENYYNSLEEDSALVPCHNFKNIGAQVPMDLYTESVSDRLERTIKNPDLRDVIGGNNFIYAGQKGISPWSIHLLALSSYAQGAYRFINGSQQLSNILRKLIIDSGGAVEKNSEVISCKVEERKVVSMSTKSEEYEADYFISSIHPQALLPMLPQGSVRKIYRERVMEIENLPSCFGLYINLKKDTFPFFNNNFYYHDKGDPWYKPTKDDASWPRMYYITTAPHTANDEYAQTVQVLAYMDYDEVAEWSDSIKKERPEAYYEFKAKKAEILLDKVAEKFPNLRDSIESMDIATPLTLRDYLGSPKGSLYGVQKDANNLQKNHINHKTKIKNLYLTGQNVASHGLVGCAMSSILSCDELVDLEKLFDELNNG